MSEIIVGTVEGVGAAGTIGAMAEGGKALSVEGGPRHAEPVSLVIEGERRLAYLPVTHERFSDFNQILSTFTRLQRELLFETDLEPGAVTVIKNLRIPMVGVVLDLTEDEHGVVKLELDSSARAFVLEPTHPNYQTLHDRVVESRDDGRFIAVTTEPDGYTVFDVTFTKGTSRGRLQGRVPKPYRTADISVVNEADRQAHWKAIMARRCCKPPSDTCIPFNFPDDGCTTKAEMICRMLNEKGVKAGKVWIRGDLAIETSNHPDCRFGWLWHVAAFVRPSETAKRDQYLVIDPTGFQDYLTLADWRKGLGAPMAPVHLTSGEAYKGVVGRHAFLRGSSVGLGTGKNDNECDDDLDFYRSLLLDRQPPPPYDCAKKSLTADAASA